MYRLIIFDVDGTFYDLDDVVLDNYNMQVDFFAKQKGINKEDVKYLFEKNSILPYKSEHACSATEFFLRNGINAEAWKAYREKYMPFWSIHRETAVSNKLLAQFSELAKLVLLSSNTFENIKNILNWLKIDVTLFDNIFCSTTDCGVKPFSKLTAIPFILSRYKMDAQSVLCVGDRYESDIRPLVELGGDGVLIDKPEDLKEVYQDLFYRTLKEKQNTSYKFFGIQKEGRRQEE